MRKTERGTDCEAIHTEAVDAALRAMPADKALRALSSFYKVMGDTTRLRLLCALSERELCVCDLAVLLDMTKSAVSHQLRILRHTKLVRTRREGKHVFYMLDDDHVRGVLELGTEHVEEDCR